MDEELLGKKEQKRKKQLRQWWITTTGQKRPEDVSRIQEEMLQDRKRLLAVCEERSGIDGAELVDCIVRLTNNSYAFAHYTGFRRGYKVGIVVGKDASEEKIIKIMQKNLDAPYAEMCDLIDAHNSQFEDLNDLRRIHIIWPDLVKKRLWVKIAKVQKVKQYLYRAKERAQQISRVRSWQEIMKEHEARRKRAKP